MFEGHVWWMVGLVLGVLVVGVTGALLGGPVMSALSMILWGAVWTAPGSREGS